MVHRKMPRRAFGLALTSALGGAAILDAASVEAKTEPAGAALRRGAGWMEAAAGAPPAKRLPDATRELARRAMSGEHGRSMRNAEFSLGESERADLSQNMIYAKALLMVAERAPLRVLPGEKIVGSATLLEAAGHSTPVAGIGSTSHTTIGFHRVLRTGYAGLRRQIEERLARPASGSVEDNATARDLLESMKLCLDAAATWHRRHMELLDERIAATHSEERDEYVRVRETLARVPEEAPRTFREAVQSLWFMYAFQRLAGNWSGIGRIDEMLGPYLDADLRAGRITLDEARDILAHFWIKGCEWTGVPGAFGGSGDAQYYQNIILGGVDAAGREVTNHVTYLVLDIVEELHISDFPVAVRLNGNSPRRLLERIADVQRRGGGIVAVYNEDVVIDGLVKFGFPVEEARTFTNDGCWEVLIPGRTSFIYVPFDALALLHDTLGLSETAPAPAYPSFDALYADYVGRLKKQVDEIQGGIDSAFKGGPASPLLSMFVEDCIERGRGYHDRGARYVIVAPHAGGLANVANSLLVLKKLVYEQQFLPLAEFVEVLRCDWKGNEPLRRMIGSRFEFYGNDSDEADAMMRRVHEDYAALAGAVHERNGVLRPPGISTFGREIEWAVGAHARRQASPDGHHKGAVLATNCSPSPGTDGHGPTAALRSYCKLDFTRTPNGAAFELKIHPAGLDGDAGCTALVALLRGFVRLGGMFMHIDVVDSAMLLDAQRNPDRYPNLAVRIAGWSARFATLNKQWQDMIIQRTQHWS